MTTEPNPPNENETLRQSFLPEHIATLFVGESAPDGPRFFYKGNGSLFNELKKLLRGSDNFLAEFRQRGFYLDDLVPYPVDHMERKDRRLHCKQAVPSLAARLRTYRPQAIVIIGRGVDELIRKAAQDAGFKGPIYATPFPGRPEHREQFRQDIAACVAQLPTAK